jgi:bifunctional DNA-binding transcriptional regulator/antitoxin component of YhaV-PrlF toxin-antitoxin module
METFSGIRDSGEYQMELVRLGKKGQVSIPTAMLRRQGLEGDSWLIAEACEDGTIVLRPAAIYPIEIYTDERVKEFEQENEMTEEERERVREVLERR